MRLIISHVSSRVRSLTTSTTDLTERESARVLEETSFSPKDYGNLWGKALWKEKLDKILSFHIFLVATPLLSIFPFISIFPYTFPLQTSQQFRFQVKEAKRLFSSSHQT